MNKLRINRDDKQIKSNQIKNKSGKTLETIKIRRQTGETFRKHFRYTKIEERRKGIKRERHTIVNNKLEIVRTSSIVISGLDDILSLHILTYTANINLLAGFVHIDVAIGLWLRRILIDLDVNWLAAGVSVVDDY